MKDPALRSPDFKLFIVSLLVRLSLREESLKILTDEESMVEFSRSFTHKSWSKSFNYERYEFLGDTVVNDAVALYIGKNFPEIQNVAWMTRIKHTLISKKFLARLAIRAKFLRHVRFGAELASLVAVPHTEQRPNKEYLSLLEDTFEAFVGCLREVVNRKSSPAVGAVIAQKMVFSFLRKQDVPITYDEIFDPKSRLKEIYDKFHWGFSVRAAGKQGSELASMVTRRQTDGSCMVLVYGYPLGNKQRVPLNRTLLWSAKGSTKDVTQQEAAKGALAVLERDFRIVEHRSSPG